jgi:Amidase
METSRPHKALGENSMLAKRDFIKGLLASAGSVVVAPAFARDGSDADLCYASVSELIAGFKARRLSPVDLLQAQIKRIEEYNPLINAITYKHFDQAMADAKASEERYNKGTERPLEGITVAIKDENDRVGWRTTMGSLVYKDAPFATENSPIIDALEAAAAVLHSRRRCPNSTSRSPLRPTHGEQRAIRGTWNIPRADPRAAQARPWPRGSQHSRPALTWGVQSGYRRRSAGSMASSRPSDGSRRLTSRMRAWGHWPEGSTTCRASRKPGCEKVPGSGRRPGSRNKTTLLRLEALRLAGEQAAKERAELMPQVPPAPVSGAEYLSAIINSASPEIDVRTRVTAASVLARLEARPPADPSDSAKLINGEWDDAKAARLEFLRHEREKRGQ